jgi:hypothetical protein
MYADRADYKSVHWTTLGPLLVFRLPSAVDVISMYIAVYPLKSSKATLRNKASCSILFILVSDMTFVALLPCALRRLASYSRASLALDFEFLLAVVNRFSFTSLSV